MSDPMNDVALLFQGDEKYRQVKKLERHLAALQLCKRTLVREPVCTEIEYQGILDAIHDKSQTLRDMLAELRERREK